MRRRRGWWPAAVLAWAVIAGLPAPPVAAHGGVVWIDDNYGAFHLVVQVTPTSNDREARFTVVVNRPNYGDPISDAQVGFRAVLSGTQASPVAPVTLTIPAERGQDGFYDATLTLPRYGDWQVQVQVQRGGASAAAGFVLPMQPPPDLTSPVWLFALLPILISVGAAVFLYFWRVPGGASAGPPPSPGSGETPGP